MLRLAVVALNLYAAATAETTLGRVLCLVAATAMAAHTVLARSRR